MRRALVFALFWALNSSAAHERGEARANGDAKQQPQQRLVQHASTDCYTDADCGNNEFCNNGACDSADTICYGDDECRGRQICDMGTYICVDPTPSPVTTGAPGCCYGDSYKANEKCVKSIEQGMCERNGCAWRETDDAGDCEVTSTTEEAGCCSSDSTKKFAMCNEKETRETCERSASCFFVSGIDAVCEPQATTVNAGCCRGSSYKAQAKCFGLEDEKGCERKDCEWLETDDPSDCVLTTTSTTTTTTTDEPGCCKGSSYKNQAKCLGFDVRADCERRGCEFVSGGEPADCVITTTTTTTTTEEPGCCKGDSAKSNPMCNAREGRERCEKSSSCHFVSGGELEKDCIVDETTTIVPGCCYINPETAYSKKYQETCTGFYTERDCLKLTDSNGVARCQFEELIEGYDCSLLWPTTTTTTEEPGCCRGDSYKSNDKCNKAATRDRCEDMGCAFVSGGVLEEDCVLTTTSTTTTTEEPGCCKGDSAKSNPMCNARVGRERCEKSSSCHFVSGGELEKDCIVDETTTIIPGCCYGNPDAAYNKKWQDTCTGYFTERDCIKMTDGEGAARCAWEPLGEYMDCEMLWPTTTTTTEEPGCCKGSSYKAQAKCLPLMDEMGCARKGCEWIVTDEPDDCIITTTTTTTTTTTAEPGCCKGDSARTNERCNKMEGREKCERSSSCHFISGGVVEKDCVVDETTTSEPGCCYGNPDAAYSKRWMESCTAFYTERDCLLLTNGDGEARCAWEALGEGYDCAQLWPTTTTTTEEPGCCRGYSYKAQSKCLGLTDEMGCARKDCEWVVTDDIDECILTTTTTTTTTTTVAPGCCKADNAKHQDMCDMKETESKCERSSSCFWVLGDDASLCEHEETTTIIPGCCYGNPDAAYSKRWMESCTAFYTERDCLLLTNDDGDFRCAWEALGDGYDCAQLWPTTTSTTTEPGCCYGDTAASNEMCATFDDDADKCDARGQCVFRSGDSADCTFVPTTTTEEIGCCAGTTRKSAEMCAEKDGREQCERSGKCSFVVTDDDSDCDFPTTTSEPWLNAKHSAKGKKRAKGANAQQSMLFGGEASSVAEAMQYQVSLSTVLAFVVAAFALNWAYQCFVAKRNDGFKNIDAVRATSTYQAV